MLRTAASSVLSAWQCGGRVGVLGQLGQPCSALLAGSTQDAEDVKPAAVEVRGFAATAQGQTLAAQHAMALPQTGPLQAGPSMVRHLSTLLMAKASTSTGRAPLGLGRRLPALPLPAQAAAQPSTTHQTRSINAWSPAQRYFVEGDHVIAAEANRTIQFTGLDAGSFYPFVIWTTFATAVAAVFVVVPFLLAPTRVDLDKSSAYECGFDAFGEARQTFSVSFYLVSIMYLLFDIEIAYLFPYVMTHANTPMFWTMNLFLGILVAGFVYEWGVGALEWRESSAH